MARGHFQRDSWRQVSAGCPADPWAAPMLSPILERKKEKKKAKNLMPQGLRWCFIPQPSPSEDNRVVSNLHQREETGMRLFIGSTELS